MVIYKDLVYEMWEKYWIEYLMILSKFEVWVFGNFN